MTKKEKCSKTQKGRIVIHKDLAEKRIYKEDLEKYLNEGWIKGQSKKHINNNSISHKGNLSPNKGIILNDDVKNKISNTLKTKYKNNDIKVWNKGLTKETDERVNSYSKKSNKTRIEKYGSTSPNLGKHLSKEHKKKIGEANKKALTGRKIPKSNLEIKLSKEYLTKKLNNSFNTSSPEEKLYKKLLEENRYKTILRRYKEERYPFYCDFYIVEDDLFIELNAHWTHGGKPFNATDIECQEKLKIWQEKAKTSKFYENAIETWTIRDVKKQKIASQNNLNYKVIY